MSRNQQNGIANLNSSKGISGRLLLAVLILCSLPVLGATVVFLARDNVQTPLQEATQRNIDFNAAAVATSGHVRVLSGLISSGLPEDADDAEFAAILRSQTAGLVRQAVILDSGRQTQADSGTAGFSSNASAIDEQVKTVLVSIKASDQATAGLTDAVDTATNSANLLIERTIAARESTGNASSDTQAAVELRFGARNLVVIANSMRDDATADAVQLASVEYLRLVRELVTQAARLQDTALAAALSEPLNALYETAVGEDGLFARASRRQQALASRKREVEVLQRMLAATADLLAREEQRNIEGMGNRLLEAQAAFKDMHRTLSILALISVLLSVFVSYWLVYRGLVVRLRRLADTTDRLSRGELDTPVKRIGNDELTVIGDALEMFRNSALRLAENEHDLQQRTAQLEQVNAELDKFAYVASHDLRSPLRAIENLAGFLREDLGDGIPDESRKHLDLMSRRIRRLDQLLTSLLEYSRVGRVGLKVELVNINRLIREIGDMLLRDTFELIIEGDPVPFYAHKAPLSQVIRNLIDNAQKHHDAGRGKVTVRLQVENSTLLLRVSDDGPGIPLKFHERIFELFQTLKPRDQTEGSGMGLSILQKLTDSFGGRIRVESNPEIARGTTFYVDWPVYSHPDEVPASNDEAVAMML